MKEELKQAGSNWRNFIDYKQLPEWRKFFYGWRSALNMAGVKALWSYPINYYKLWRMLKK